MKNLISFLFCLALFAFVSPPVQSQVCATYCPGQAATAGIPPVIGATSYSWDIVGPEVLPFAGNGTEAISIASVGNTEGIYVVTVTVIGAAPTLCQADTACTFEVTQPVGVAVINPVCLGSGIVDLTAIAQTLTPLGGTFSWTDSSGNPQSGTLLDTSQFPAGVIPLTYTVNAGACNITVSTDISIEAPPPLPQIIMG